jgi:peptidoglycan/LPS O-acetylase OafA/YrhL
MFFYVIFAMMMVFRRQIAIPAIGGALILFAQMGPFLPLDELKYLSSPIVLWFVTGIGLAVIWRWCCFTEPKMIASLARFLGPCGDASYSTYLVHGVALTILLRIWVIVLGTPSAWFVAIGLAAATIAGLGVHIMLEKPILRMVTGAWEHIETVCTSLRQSRRSRDSVKKPI